MENNVLFISQHIMMCHMYDTKHARLNDSLHRETASDNARNTWSFARRPS